MFTSRGYRHHGNRYREVLQHPEGLRLHHPDRRRQGRVRAHLGCCVCWFVFVLRRPAKLERDRNRERKAGGVEPVERRISALSPSTITDARPQTPGVFVSRIRASEGEPPCPTSSASVRPCISKAPPKPAPRAASTR